MIKKLSIPIKYIWNHPVTKDRRYKGMFRFLNWQLKSSLNKGYHQINWIRPLRLNVDKGMHGATGCIYVGLPEFNDMAFLLHYLTKEDTFLDLGANVGVYSLLASGIKNCKSLTVEPIPETFEKLNLNIKVNNLEQLINSLNIGLSFENGELSFTQDQDTINHVSDVKGNNTIEIPVKTLDDVLSTTSVSDNILMKLDVEGFEFNVLKGASNLLASKKVSAIIVELNNSSERYGMSDDMVDELLTNAGFVKHNYDPFTRILKEIKTYHPEENTLYLLNSKVDDIASRLKAAPAFTIYDKTI